MRKVHGMDESRARALLEQAAGIEMAPSRVDVGLALRQGRTRLRRRRVGLASGPAAAVAGVAVIIAAIGPFGAGTASKGNAATSPHAATSRRLTPPRRFNPLIPYVSFGWLPRGSSLEGGQLASTYAYLVAGPSGRWGLTVYAAGRCDLTTKQVLRQLREHRQPKLNCTTSPSSGWVGQIVTIVPPVDRHSAFLISSGPTLVWEYARGSWAALAYPRGRAGLSRAEKVADYLRYGVATKPSIEFPVQLTGLPAASRVYSTYFVPYRGVLRVSQYSLVGAGTGMPNLTTDPATKSSSCYFYPGGESVRETINGYHVVVNHIPGHGGAMPVQQVCAARADGLSVFVSTYGKHDRPDAIAIFARHTRLLGTNPADWTTAPLG
jgi:hypothetical protein